MRNSSRTRPWEQMLLSVFPLLSSSYMVRVTYTHDTTSFVMNHKGEYRITFRVPKDDGQIKEQEATIRVSCIFLTFNLCPCLNVESFAPNSHRRKIQSCSFQVIPSKSPLMLFSCDFLTTHWKMHIGRNLFLNKASVTRNSDMKSVYLKAHICCPLAPEKSRLSELLPANLHSTVLRRGRKNNNKYMTSRSSD